MCENVCLRVDVWSVGGRWRVRSVRRVWTESFGVWMECVRVLLCPESQWSVESMNEECPESGWSVFECGWRVSGESVECGRRVDGVCSSVDGEWMERVRVWMESQWSVDRECLSVRKVFELKVEGTARRAACAGV